jgi:hypothetical protein
MAGFAALVDHRGSMFQLADIYSAENHGSPPEGKLKRGDLRQP